jgi:hypothetical protein
MARLIKEWKPVVTGRVFDAVGKGPVRLAEVVLEVQEAAQGAPAKGAGKEGAGEKVTWREHGRTLTDDSGTCRFFDVEEGKTYRLTTHAFNDSASARLTVEHGCEACGSLPLEKLQLRISTLTCPGEDAAAELCHQARVGRSVTVRQEWDQIASTRWSVSRGAAITDLVGKDAQLRFLRAGRILLDAWARDKQQNSLGEHAEAFNQNEIPVGDADVNMVGGRVGVALERTAVPPTLDQALWVAIRNRTRAISFSVYSDFMDRVMAGDERLAAGDPRLERRMHELGTHMHGVGAYQVLKTATEVFLLLQCGVRIEGGRYEHHRLFNRDEESARLGEFVTLEFVSGKLREYLGTPAQLPYITRVVEAAFPEYSREGVFRDRVVSARLNEPCLIELIWSYWHEEGMLVQSMNAINRRFQNVRAPGDRDPLAHLEIDPLRKVGNLLWGQIQDELNVLSVKRRAYEYAHQYGLTLYGKAANSVRPADNRSKFLEAFHNLLHLASIFYKEDNDTTVIADGYPLLNALREVHLLLSQGAHNQFGDLPWTARAEMMVMQWILARPEIRDFLQSRVMVPYKEAWMPQVDTMKNVQAWSDVTVTHFRDLGVYGEQILLSMRYGDWIDVNDEDSAKNWARYWRPEIQAYLHAYRAATGVDLTNPDTVDATVPAVLLQKRLLTQQRMR